MRKIIILGALLLLPGCVGQTLATVTAPAGTVATAPSQAPGDPLASLASFTVSDLQAASADAKAQTPPDTTAAQCYDFLATVIPTLQPPTPGNIKLGAFIAFQKARDLANGTTSNSGFLKQMNLACAALVIDTQTVINKLLLLGAGTAATGGALGPALPGLGALGATLPIPLP